MQVQRSKAEIQNLLAAELVTRELIECDARWSILSGGRTNYLWRVDGAKKSFVVKLYPQTGQAPLFRNDDVAEAEVLRKLTGHNLSADLYVSTISALGPCIIYHHVDGAPWKGDVTVVSNLLARLHSLQVEITLPNAPSGSKELCEQALQILAGCETGSAEILYAHMPKTTVPASSHRCLLHGDVVANNILVNDGKARLIDWQCPMLGEPAADIAIFMSPAMQSLYDGVMPTAQFRQDFFAAYGCAQTEARYHALAPWYHWRMAAYCLWKSEHGAMDYHGALELELEMLSDQNRKITENIQSRV